ncbi:hypothetical protein BC938DRAFT_479779 [Jimgerdemannia flammicorona]|uniref:Uncharacterized protein n=1 Tax=Jimgerdemannia flammicorona TaxID=994334 RepID=A0A433QK55_9FUNG|nr:hypothetical protein BC938DRAFT_479779 [Jimgerdemannia flammicorona]
MHHHVPRRTVNRGCFGIETGPPCLLSVIRAQCSISQTTSPSGIWRLPDSSFPEKIAFKKLRRMIGYEGRAKYASGKRSLS